MRSVVKPNAWVALRLPSDTLKVLQITPNTTVSLGKYGTFLSNLIISRPYHLTYEILDRPAGQRDSCIRVVPAAELHADVIAEEKEANGSSTPSQNEISLGDSSTEFQLVSESGEVIMRTNRETIDDSARQTLTMQEIETLKREGTGAGQEIISKLMASHLGIEQKTAFSLAKYKLLKTRKYLRRFTVLPMDVRILGDWMVTEKDSGKVMDFREEMLSLVGSWSNVHYAQEESLFAPGTGGGRWLVVDETGGLLVAAMAERMGILHPEDADDDGNEMSVDQEMPEPEDGSDRNHTDVPLATSNTLTLLHSNAQPNLSLLSYFNYNPNTLNALRSSPPHPLSTHLQSISWLQLLSPEKDTTYSTEIPALSPAEISEMKSGKRGTYFRKLRRKERVRQTVDTTRAGSFSGLAIASYMDPISILRHTIPLLQGGSPVSVYSPTIEPLLLLSDAYSTSRRTAFIQAPPEEFECLPENERASWKGNEDFPLNPTLLLNTNVQSARVRKWQVLPGRTHPLMTGRGGAEGYLFTGTRVLPASGKVEARGKFNKKKVDDKEVDSVVRIVDAAKRERASDGEQSDLKRAKVEDSSDRGYVDRLGT